MSATHVRQKARVARDLLLLSVRGGMKCRRRSPLRGALQTMRVAPALARTRRPPIRFLPA